jgi:nicotinate-nucleotide adenylyltransferase
MIGGSFDPIHYGHLAIAEEARVALGLQRVVFVPTAWQPLKANPPGASSDHRLVMVQRACAGNPAFDVSPIEVEREGLSYTVTTLESLAASTTATWYLILGADAVASLPRWRAVERILELASIVVIGRPGVSFDRTGLVEHVPALAGRLSVLDGPHLDLSSSELRQRIAAGKPIRYLTPDAVVDYITAHQLYQPG